MSSSRRQSQSAAGGLSHGKACLNCRRRKQRCDGGRPVCGQCIAKNDDCEYTDQQGRTRSQVLEEEVTRLQSRIRELEDPTSRGITLVDPHAAYHAAQRRRTATTDIPVVAGPSSAISIAADEQRILHSYGTSSPFDFPIAPELTYGPQDVRLALGTADAATAIVPGFTSAFPSLDVQPPAADAWWEDEEPPAQVARMLVNTFLPHARQLGFALDIPRFVTSFSFPILDPRRPCPSLLHIIYLWGLRLSQSPSLMAQETQFLRRSVQALMSSLASLDSQRRVQAMQAEVLLAQYFFCQGRYLEGQYHANAVISLAISTGLHRIRSSNAIATTMMYGNIGPMRNLVGISRAIELAEPRDAMEERERIHLFWTIFNMDHCWCVAMGVPPLLNDDGALDTQIDTPWPLDFEMFSVPPDNIDQQRGHQTIKGFLDPNRPLVDRANPPSAPALRVQASVLFEQAARLVSHWHAGTLVTSETPHRSHSELLVLPSSSGLQPSDAYHTSFRSLERVILSYFPTLPPLEQIQGRNHDTRCLLVVTHTIAHAALILTHSVRANSDPNAREISLRAARDVLGILDYTITNDLTRLEPIVTPAWMAASRVFGLEVERLQVLAATSPLGSTSRELVAVMADVVRMRHLLTRILAASPVLSYQLSRILEVLAMIDRTVH